VVHRHGIDAVFSVLSRPETLEQALEGAAANLRASSRNIAAALKLGFEMRGE
jgi:glycerate 2-kinase